MSNYKENPNYFAPYLKYQGRTIEEQLRLNQPAMEWLKKQIEEKVTETEIQTRKKNLEKFKQIIDSFRPSGYKLYSEK
ncbi:MAG: hypothetical protein F6K54_23780 [Okeania sp. SIO3B5]|uniref:hypothetical protein n=1 Tax=Okeania sp. SIO3B5 TaxID=2607811 RepID=UPI0014014207|nr:hypothetical protein [Okeania sp. SIO3B5]NEO55821.1 hypothetical protein [Okeania sp. SIO3B5]